jgi:hypothetical protein
LKKNQNPRTRQVHVFEKIRVKRTSWFWAFENSQNQRTIGFSYSITLGELQGFMKEPEVI